MLSAAQVFSKIAALRFGASGGVVVNANTRRDGEGILEYAGH